MLKRTLSSLLLCVAFGALACSESQDGYFGDSENVTTTAQAENVMKPEPAASKDASQEAAPSEEGIADPVSDDPTPPPEPVPEPMTMLLFGSGLAGVAYRYRRKRGEGEVEEQLV